MSTSQVSDMAANLQHIYVSSLLLSSNFMLPILTLTLAVYCFACILRRSSMVPPLPPGPRGLPLLGSLPFLQPDLPNYLAKLARKYGPIFKLQLGRKIWVVVSSASLAKEALKDQGAIFSDRDIPRAALAGMYGGCDIGFSNNGPEWREMRKIFASELMSKDCLQACSEFRRREVRLMVKEIRGEVGSGVDIGEKVLITLLNILTSMLWGSTFSSKDSRILSESKHVIDEFLRLLGKPNVSDFFPLIARFDLQGIESEIKKKMLWFDQIFEAAIASKRERAEAGAGSKTGDFLQLLLESSLSMEQIKGVLMDVIVAGTDPTSVTVEWAMTELLSSPEKLRKLQEEIDSVVGEQNIVEESHLEKLVYQEAVIKEVLRLHPPAPLLIPHSPSRTCSLAGYTVPKGCSFLVNVWAIQREPEAWGRPLAFEPERFMNDTGKFDLQGNNFNYFPFGSGRRICAGLPLAERMGMYILATLVHAFDWRVPDDVKLDFGEKFGIVLRKERPLIAIPTARLRSEEQYI